MAALGLLRHKYRRFLSSGFASLTGCKRPENSENHARFPRSRAHTQRSWGSGRSTNKGHPNVWRIPAREIEERVADAVSFLVPDIVAAIVGGAQPSDFTAETLTKRADLSLGWAEQVALLGFAEAP